MQKIMKECIFNYFSGQTFVKTVSLLLFVSLVLDLHLQCFHWCSLVKNNLLIQRAPKQKKDFTRILYFKRNVCQSWPIRGQEVAWPSILFKCAAILTNTRRESSCTLYNVQIWSKSDQSGDTGVDRVNHIYFK